MPLADTYARVYQVLGAQGAIEDRRRKRDSEESIAQLYSSGQPVGPESIQKLLASGADPAAVASIAKMYQGEGLAKEKKLNLQSQRGVRGAEALAGMGAEMMRDWNSLPPEKQTMATWRAGYLARRNNAIRQGIATPEMLPEDLGPQDVQGMIGLGFSPAQQDLSASGVEEAGARQSRFEQSEAAKQGRFAQSQAGIDRRSSLARATASGGGDGAPKPLKVSQFDRDLSDAGYAPGSPEYLKAKRIKLGLEKGAGSGSGGSGQINQRQMANIQNKLQTIGLLKQQVQGIKNAFGPIKGSYSAGPGADYLPTEKGQAFDAAVAGMSPILRQLTRTPGEGAMSDYESRLAEALLPSRGKYESVTAQQIQQVEDMINQLESGYMGMMQDAGGGTATAGGARVDAQQGAPAAKPAQDPAYQRLLELRAKYGR